MLNKDQTLFVLVDVQGKLAKIVHDSEQILENIKKLIQALMILEIPIVSVEQYPEGLGATVEEISQYLTHLIPIHKIAFNACKNNTFIEAVKSSGRQQILVAGIETHVCVYQTAIGLKNLGYEVHVVADAVSSRTFFNKEIGLEKMKQAGIIMTSVETALFELIEIAEGEKFKQILKLLR